jgi:hypothetical protein
MHSVEWKRWGLGKDLEVDSYNLLQYTTQAFAWRLKKKKKASMTPDGALAEIWTWYHQNTNRDGYRYTNLLSDVEVVIIYTPNILFF